VSRYSHTQLYVALSRATSGQKIQVLLPEEGDNHRTRNVVYPEVLVDAAGPRDCYRTFRLTLILAVSWEFHGCHGRLTGKASGNFWNSCTIDHPGYILHIAARLPSYRHCAHYPHSLSLNFLLTPLFHLISTSPSFTQLPPCKHHERQPC
jgi:hypothetical protein